MRERKCAPQRGADLLGFDARDDLFIEIQRGAQSGEEGAFVVRDDAVELHDAEGRAIYA